MTKAPKPKPVRLKDYRPSAYLVEHVDLDIGLDPDATQVRSVLSVCRNPKAGLKTSVPLELNGELLELKEISLNGRPLSEGDYTVEPKRLVLKKPPAKPFTLETLCIVDPNSNKALQGLYRSRGVYCTQCEAEGFRRITYFLDRPDVLSTYRCRLEAPTKDAPILLANGNPVSSGKLPGKRHFAVWDDPHPKPSYLFALVGGDLGHISSRFKTMSGRTVSLKIYVEHGKEERARWAMDSLKRSMSWDEKRFGREYDLDVFNIVAVSDFNMGAMENKGLNIFNDRLILASPDTATDANYERIESVVAHEYFHNWTGNRITCRDWFQLCLKEGLTVYRDQEFSSDERARTVQRISDVRALRSAQFAEDAGPLAHPVRPDSYIEINNFYTATVYEKGAELVRMIETIVGDDAFRRGMDLFFKRHDGDAATIEDFVKCFSDASGVGLEQFMTWYNQAGTPELVCALGYDKSKKRATLTFEQVLAPTPGADKKKPQHIPVRFALIGGNGEELPLDPPRDTSGRANAKVSAPSSTGSLLHVTKRSQTFVFDDVPNRPVPSLLRDFSAPVKLTLDLSNRDLEFLMVHDRDLFNRWEAANTYASRTLIGMVRALRKGESVTQHGLSFARALAHSLNDKTLPPAYLAELLKLPSQADIARDVGRNVDPSLIHRAHRQLAKLVGRECGDQLTALYADLEDTGAFSPDAESAGRRALRNAALGLLVARGSAADKDRLSDHFFSAGNMTDEAFGLMLLVSSRHAARDDALAHFFERWQDDHLVIDTWFAAQAQAPYPGAVRTVKRLKQHPLFSMTTPNKVRALVGTFALLNPVQFHRTDGAGYELVASTVLELDQLNPSIAARMLSAFRSWRMLESTRRAAAKAVLQNVADTPNLSADVYEIVSRMLDQ